MTNFKINFITPSKVINFTDCCCPNLINVACRDLEIGQKYYVSFDDTPTYRAQIFPAQYSFIAEAQITGFQIINGGAGFTTTPTVTISGGGATVNAVVTPVLTEKTFANNVKTKTITGFTITNPGKGYVSTPTVTVSGGDGYGAVIRPILGNVIKNLTFFVAFGCNEKNMPIPTPYPSNTPTITPTPTLTQTPTPTVTPSSVGVVVLPINITTYNPPIGNSITLTDYFTNIEAYPIRVYTGQTGQNTTVPVGYDLAIFISNNGILSTQSVSSGQSITFKSTILLGKAI
jgi:hypothetical protein